MTRGQDFHARIERDYDEPDAAQAVIVEQVATLLDELEQLEAAVQVDGLTVTGGNGQLAIHPAVATARQHRLAIASLISKLGMTDGPGTVQARKAAQARWSK